ncbi:TonB-dependent receptor [Phenylobacterium sp.]|uniref:TonB-dependent receptor n=1 Tax=Phenylobacterium sp. TaxID=1871053 RepID=UPI00301D62FB
MRGFRRLHYAMGATALLAPWPSSALAQADATAAVVGEVIVTASKRELRLNDVPAAVSAFTAEDRTVSGITTTQDIANFTPGLAISDSPTRVNIRGVGRVTNELGSDPGVANYVDGFYTSEGDVIGGSDFFVDRVEVLRGPQGTLYGRNSIGGAVNVISKRPRAELRFDGRAVLNSYERYGLGASVSGPISETVRYRIAAFGTQQGEGYVRNLAGPDQWTDERYLVEGQLEVDVTPALTLWLKASHAGYDQRPRPDAVIDPWNTTTYHGGLVANPTFGHPSSQNPALEDPYEVRYDFGGRQRLTNQYSVVGHLTLETDAVIARYVGGYSQYDYYQDRDFDRTARTSFNRAAFGTSFPVSTNYVEVVREDKRWTSHELNLLSPPGGAIDWIGGLYYYRERIDQPYAITVPDVALFDDPVELAGVPSIDNPLRAYYFQRGRVRSEALAAFGQVTWRPSARWSLTGGLRYTSDEKRGREHQFQVYYDVTVDPGNTYGILNRQREARGDWQGVTGNLGVTFEPGEDTLAYGSISRGYKSGGFKLGGLIPDPEVDRETITAYEVGLKQTYGPAQFNAAVFYYDYRDLQVPVSFQVAPGIIQSVFYNAPKSHVFGAEAELSVRPAEGLTLRAIYGYLDGAFDEFSGVVDPAAANPAPQDLEGDRLPQSPKHKLTLNGVLTRGDFSFSASYSYVSAQYFTVFNTDRYRAPAYENVSIRAIWTRPDGGLRLIGSVSNVFDSTSYSYVTSGGFASGAARSVTPRLPRTFELEARVSF